MFSNELIEVDGDVATSEMYLLNLNRYEEEGWDFLLAGRYVERLERRAGEWRIAWRTRIHEITSVERIGERWVFHMARRVGAQRGGHPLPRGRLVPRAVGLRTTPQAKSRQ